MNFIQAAVFIKTNFTKLVALVAQAEALFPTGSQGAAKLQYVHDKLLTVSSFASEASGLWPFVSESIGFIVDELPKNATTTAVAQVVAVATQVLTPPPVTPSPL
jgi:hypothetical protein